MATAKLTLADITNRYVDVSTGSLDDGPQQLTARLVDIAGNAGTASPSFAVNVDTTPPTVTITASPTVLAVGGTTTITFQLSEKSSDFALVDVTSSGGTLSGFGGFDDSYTATFTLTPSSTAAGRMRIDADRFSDAAGNVSTASAPLTIAVDASPPTVTVTSNKTSLKIGETAALTFSLSDAADFTAEMATISGGLISNFAASSSPLSYTATFTPSAGIEQNGTIQIAAQKFKDPVGNLNLASNQLTLAIDTLAPAAPSPPVLLPADDSGIAGDSVTNVTQPRFSGLATAGLPVTLVATAPDGTRSDKGTVTADANGNWSIKSSVLSNGIWTVQAVTSDSVGNRSLPSPETKLTINSVTLATPVIALASSDDTGVSNVDGVTNKTTPTFLGTAAAGTTVEVFRAVLPFLVPESIGTATVNDQGQWLMPFGAAVVPFTDGLYVITARVTDVAGNVSGDATMTPLLTIDTKAPTLQTLAATLAPANQPVESVAVNFDEDVFGLEGADFSLKVLVTFSSGVNLVRTLSIAGTATVSPVPSGLGSSEWLVDDLENVVGASGTYTLMLEGSRFASGNTLPTDLAGNLLVATKTTATWTTDTTAPRVKSMTAVAAGTPATTASPWNTGVSLVNVVFDESVTGVDASDFTLVRDGNRVSLATATVSGSGAGWQLGNLSGLTATDGLYTLTLKASGAGIADIAGTGNALFADASTSWRIDKMRPTATFEAVAPSLRATPVGSVTLTFPEPVTGVGLADFTLTRGGVVVPLAGASLSQDTDRGVLPPTYASTYVLSGLAGLTAEPGSYALSFDKDTGVGRVSDAAGNQMAANPAAVTWTVDTTRPVATLTQPSPGLRNTTPPSVPVTFTMPVSGVDLNDFQLTRNGVAVPLTGPSVSGSGTLYTLTPPSGETQADGVYVLRLTAAGSGIAATAAPNNSLASDATTTWTMDATLPGVVLTVIQRVGTKATVRALFSEIVTGFVATDTFADVSILGGTISNPRNGTLVGREYLFDVTPTPATPVLPVTVTVKAAAATDAAGNASAASAALRIVNDLTPPTVVLTAPAITNQRPFVITATFSEPVTGLTTNGVTVTNGTATVLGSGNSWSIHVTPTKAGAVTVAVNAGAAKDGSDNASIASNTVRVTYDDVLPTVTLANLSGSPTRAGTILVAATFSEAVTGVTAGDLAVKSNNATVVGVTGSGRRYTFQVQPRADGPIGLQLPANKAFDAAQNGNIPSGDLSVTSDRTLPGVVSITGPVNGVVTITFSEEVRGFDRADLLLSRNGQSLGLSGATLAGPNGPNRTVWTLSLGTLVSVGGSYRLQIAASSAGIADLAGNGLVEDRASPNTKLVHNFTIDMTPPVATFTTVREVTNASLDTIGLSFNKPVTEVDLADFVLSRNGVPLGRLDTLAGVTLTPTTGPSSTYSIGGLAAWTGTDGRYVLRLVSSGSRITDAAGNAMTTAASASWTLDTRSPTATLGPVTAIVSGPISAVAVGFSELVRGVDVADFTLTRTIDGVTTTVPLTGGRLVASTTSASNFQLANLQSLTGVPGTYTLTLRSVATGIADAAGNLLAQDAAATWRNVGTPVPGSLSGAFGGIVPNPRTVPVSSIPLNFTAGVSGVDAGDFRLTRTEGGFTTVIPTSGVLTVTGSGVSWTVGGLATLTQPAGDYVLRLVAAGSGVATSTGVALQADVVASWRTVATPAAPTATIALDTPRSTGAAYDAATITFTKNVTGVKLSAFVLTRGTVPVSLTSTAFVALSPTTYRITGLAPIVTALTAYELRLVAAGSGIVGGDGSTLQTDASVTWDQTLASVRAAFLGVDRTTTSPVAAVNLRFSESVRGVDVTDFELTVDANDGLGPQVVALRGVTVTGSGTSWTVTNLAGLQAGPGRYTLRLKRANGDILTGAGAGLAEDATVEWTTA